MIREGTKVVYTGNGGHPSDPATGDGGRVLLASGDVCHVMWSVGAQTGLVTAHYDSDLVALSAEAGIDLDDSLEVGGLVAFSARHTFDLGGRVAVLNEMAALGHLTSFADIAEEALATVSARVRLDPLFRSAVAGLEEDEAESVVRLAATCLIRDAFDADAEDGF